MPTQPVTASLIGFYHMRLRKDERREEQTWQAEWRREEQMISTQETGGKPQCPHQPHSQDTEEEDSTLSRDQAQREDKKSET